MTRPDEEPPVTENHLSAQARDIEAPAEDAAEQAVPANPAEAPEEVHPGNEVNEYDALEQSLVVDLDDEYR